MLSMELPVVMKRQIKMPSAVVQVTQPKNRQSHGLGFVASGGYVVTAAHNLPRPESANGIYDHDAVVVTTSDGDDVLMEPVFVDQCADIAVLGLADTEPESVDTLDEVAPLLIAWTPAIGKGRGTVATHDRGLVKAICEVRIGSNRVLFTGKIRFAAGTSGGPVCDSKGRVMAVVSQTTSAHAHRLGWGPAIGECLPAWLARKIAGQEKAVAGSLKAAKPVGRTTRRRTPRAGG